MKEAKTGTHQRQHVWEHAGFAFLSKDLKLYYSELYVQEHMLEESGKSTCWSSMCGTFHRDLLLFFRSWSRSSSKDNTHVWSYRCIQMLLINLWGLWLCWPSLFWEFQIASAHCVRCGSIQDSSVHTMLRLCTHFRFTLSLAQELRQFMLKWLIVFSQSLLDPDTNPLLKAGVLNEKQVVETSWNRMKPDSKKISQFINNNSITIRWRKGPGQKNVSTHPLSAREITSTGCGCDCLSGPCHQVHHGRSHHQGIEEEFRRCTTWDA